MTYAPKRLMFIDDNPHTVRAWQEAFKAYDHISVMGGSMFNLPKSIRVDAYVIGTSALGDLLVPRSLHTGVAKKTPGAMLIQTTLQKSIPALGLKSMLDRDCLPVGFSVLLKKLSGPPFAIAVPIQFAAPDSYGGDDTTPPRVDRTKNGHYAFLAVIRLIEHYNKTQQPHERIECVALPNLAPRLPAHESARAFLNAWHYVTTSNHHHHRRRHKHRVDAQGALKHGQYYIPNYLACPQEHTTDNLEFEPFFESRYLPDVKVTVNALSGPLTKTKKSRHTPLSKNKIKHLKKQRRIQRKEENEAQKTLDRWKSLALQTTMYNKDVDDDDSEVSSSSSESF